MVNSVLFTLADVIARGVRNRFRVPFGGLAVLALGDPLQGAAVNTLGETTIGGKAAPWASTHALTASVPSNQS